MKYTQYKHLSEDYIKRKISEFLQEDIPTTDITADLTINDNEIAEAIIQAEQDIIFVGKDIIKAFFDDSFVVDFFVNDGDFVYKQGIIARVKGNSKYILKVERTLLNLIQRLCGISTLTNKYVELARPHNVAILDTRKTIPGLRMFDKYAVAAAGGQNHRLDLSSGILIKDNHIANKNLDDVLAYVINKNTNSLPIELEVDNLMQINIALKYPIDGLLLDNMSPANVAEAIFIIKEKQIKNIYVEASGGINLNNINGYLTTGIDAISIGALTHSAIAANIHLEFNKI